MEPALSQGGPEPIVLSNVGKAVQKERIVSLSVSARGKSFRSTLGSRYEVPLNLRYNRDRGVFLGSYGVV